MRYEIDHTEEWKGWFDRLGKTEKTRVLARLDRVETGNFGDHKQLSDNFFELRFFFGSGLRVYYTIRKSTIVLLLAGGDKDTQGRDTADARAMLNELED